MTEWRPLGGGEAIEAIWYIDGAVSNFRELHPPTGWVDIVIQLDDSFRRVNGWVLEGYPAASLAGLQISTMRIEAFRRHQAVAHRTRILGMRFDPAMAFALIGHPLVEATSRIIDLEDILGKAAQALIAGCYEASDAEQCVRHAARWASARIAESTHLDRPIHWCARQIQRNGGRVAVARLQRETGLTSQQLTDRFRRQIGVTPKMYARIIRFRCALTLLYEGVPAADVAVRSGYYDQPHMNLDFRALAGLTPRQLLDARRHGDFREAEGGGLLRSPTIPNQA